MKIELQNLKFGYDKKIILDNVSYTFESGKAYLLSGENGSGKTTLSKLILGLLTPDFGSVLVDGVKVTKKLSGKLSKSIGYLFQNPDMQFFAPTVSEEIRFPFELLKELNKETEEKIARIMETLKLDKISDRFPLTLSSGEKQRLALATLISREVKFIILDEPSASVDTEGKAFLIDFLNGFVKGGGGAIVISHDEDLGKIVGLTSLRLAEGKLCV